jgi:hypothetical protein
VPERELGSRGAEHADRNALLDGLDLIAQQLDQEPRFDPEADHRRAFEGSTSGGREAGRPGEYGIADAVRNFLVGDGEDLGEEERVPAGAATQLQRIQHGYRGQASDSVLGERGEGDPTNDVAGREITENALERVLGADLVIAVRRDEENAAFPDPAAEELQEVQRRVVGPMHVLEHEDHGH